MSEEPSGRKDDAGKLRWRLLPIDALRGVVQVLEFGANRYGEWNWVLVPGHEDRYYDATIRHLTSWYEAVRSGDAVMRRDPESGLSHLAHAACCVLFLLSQELKEKKP